MNSTYLYDYTNLFERVLSVGYCLCYCTSAIERAISYSSFFQKVENDKDTFAPIIVDSLLVKEIFPEYDVDLLTTPIYNQCLWAAEAYLRIQGESHLTFETIFLYLPIGKMYDLFSVYHEMDFSQIVQYFMSLTEKKTVFALLLDKFKYSIKDISETTNIPYATLFSLKQGHRDMKKTSIEVVNKLATLLRVRLETLAELKL